MASLRGWLERGLEVTGLVGLACRLGVRPRGASKAHSHQPLNRMRRDSVQSTAGGSHRRDATPEATRRSLASALAMCVAAADYAQLVFTPYRLGAISAPSHAFLAFVQFFSSVSAALPEAVIPIACAFVFCIMVSSVLAVVPKQKLVLVFPARLIVAGQLAQTVMRTVLAMPILQTLLAVALCGDGASGGSVLLGRGSRLVPEVANCSSGAHFGLLAVAVVSAFVFVVTTFIYYKNKYTRVEMARRSMILVADMVNPWQEIFHMSQKVVVTVSILFIAPQSLRAASAAVFCAAAVNFALMQVPRFRSALCGEWHAKRSAGQGAVLYASLVGLVSALAKLGPASGAALSEGEAETVKDDFNVILWCALPAALYLGFRVGRFFAYATIERALRRLQGGEVASLNLASRVVLSRDYCATRVPAAIASHRPSAALQPLVSLDLSHNLLTSDACRLIAATLIYVPTLEVLTLEHNAIGPHNGLGALLAVHPTLRSLSLRDNPDFGDDATQELCLGLVANGSLQRLDLSRCSLSPASALFVAKALCSERSKLLHLQLNENDIGEVGVRALAAAIQQGTSKLRRLELQWVIFSDEEAEALLQLFTRLEVVMPARFGRNGISRTLLSRIQGSVGSSQEDLDPGGIATRSRSFLRQDLQQAQSSPLANPLDGALHDIIDLEPFSPSRDAPSPTGASEGQSLQETLLAALGGEAMLSKIVDEFYYRVVSDLNLRHFFANITMGRMRHLQFSYLCCLFGGPGRYKGRGLAEAHAEFEISDDHYDAVVDHLFASIVHCYPAVSRDALGKLDAILEGLRDKIVNKGLVKSWATAAKRVRRLRDPFGLRPGREPQPPLQPAAAEGDGDAYGDAEGRERGMEFTDLSVTESARPRASEYGAQLTFSEPAAEAATLLSPEFLEALHAAGPELRRRALAETALAPLHASPLLDPQSFVSTSAALCSESEKTRRAARERLRAAHGASGASPALCTRLLLLAAECVHTHFRDTSHEDFRDWYVALEEAVDAAASASARERPAAAPARASVMEVIARLAREGGSIRRSAGFQTRSQSPAVATRLAARLDGPSKPPSRASRALSHAHTANAVPESAPASVSGGGDSRPASASGAGCPFAVFRGPLGGPLGRPSIGSVHGPISP